MGIAAWRARTRRHRETSPAQQSYEGENDGQPAIGPDHGSKRSSSHVTPIAAHRLVPEVVAGQAHTPSLLIRRAGSLILWRGPRGGTGTPATQKWRAHGRVKSPVESGAVLRELWSRKRLLVLGVAISALAALLTVDRIPSVLPPKLQGRSLEYAGVYTKVYVDSPLSFIGSTSVNLGPLVYRAGIYANVMASPAGVALTGKYAGIPSDQIYAAGPLDPNEQRTVQEPTATKRNVQITGETVPYRLDFNTDANLPTISIYAQAPSVGQAVALANASVHALAEYVQALENQQNVASGNRLIIKQLGQPWGGIVDGGITKKLAGLVFFSAFLAWCIIVLAAVRIRASWIRTATPKMTCGVGGEDQPPRPQSAETHTPEPEWAA